MLHSLGHNNFVHIVLDKTKVVTPIMKAQCLGNTNLG